MGGRIRISVTRAGLALAAALAGGSAGAVPLDSETCEALKAEHSLLAGAGVKADMQHGPEWAKSNLPAERLQRILRFIEVEQQLLFRCPSAAERAEEERRKELDARKATEAKAGEEAAKEPATKPEPAKADAPGAAGPAASKDKASGAEKEPQGKAKPKAKAEAKVKEKPKAKAKTAKHRKAPANDAYSPTAEKAGEAEKKATGEQSEEQ